eukprot:TRINITY_DN9418_c0_g1_i1.p2 TRINITY_DN9418_c0_g1~~TRINITY_DN9418_c0_g1_i1.p2  ORF type:complete len:117 (+),score=13.83 TRINITY_DN9418_c0_g1_i1:108-458(+)
MSGHNSLFIPHPLFHNPHAQPSHASDQHSAQQYHEWQNWYASDQCGYYYEQCPGYSQWNQPEDATRVDAPLQTHPEADPDADVEADGGIDLSINRDTLKMLALNSLRRKSRSAQRR